MKIPIKNQTEKHGAPRRSAPAFARGGKLRPARLASVAHVLNTLPDSLSRREKVLKALSASLPPGAESAVLVRTMQFLLHEHQRLRFEWPADQP
jgi:hypothetical protein